MKRLLAAFLFFLSLPLLATTVNVTTPGIISLGPASTVTYSQQWVMQKTDFGFLWLDSTNLVGGLVQVQAKCGVGQPAASTGLYPIGDCNGITSYTTNHMQVQAFQYSGQCGACTQGCGGPRDDGHWNFVFAVGTWEYLSQDSAIIGQNSLTTDLVGRTWVATPTDGTGTHFVWTSTASGTPTPTPPPGATNTPTPTRTPTPTWTPGGPTATPTNTPSNTPTRTNTPTPTNTNTPTPTPTGNIAPSVVIQSPAPGSASFVVTNTTWKSSITTLNWVDFEIAANNCSFFPTATPTATSTPTPTVTFTATPTPTGTRTPTNTPTDTPTITPTPTPILPITPTPTPAVIPARMGQMPGSFLSVNGKATLVSPKVPGFYCLALTYHYTPRGQARQTKQLLTTFVVN